MSAEINVSTGDPKQSNVAVGIDADCHIKC